MLKLSPEELGVPDLKVGCLSIWVFMRAYEDSHDYWDGNWLTIRAQYETLAARVCAGGTILNLVELRHWRVANPAQDVLAAAAIRMPQDFITL